MIHFSRLFPLSLASLLAVGCKARSFNKPVGAAVRSETGTTSELPVPAGVDPKLLTNLAAPEDDPKVDVAADVIVMLPTGGAFATLRDRTGRPLGLVSNADAVMNQPWSVPDYEKILKKAHDSDVGVSASGPFAAASVLEVLRRNRQEFARRIEGGVDNVPNLLGERALLEATAKVSVGFDFETVDPARPFSKTPCYSYDPRDFGDIKWHYYCQIPGAFRACQRLLVGYYFEKKLTVLSSAFEEKRLSPKPYSSAVAHLRREDEEAVRSYCMNPTAFADKETKALYDSTMIGFEKNFSLSAGSLARLFQKFYASQKDESTGVNMYDYIMRSGIYAWDFEQQQAVLNTFYGSLKPTAEKPFNPSDPQDCKTYREPRASSEAVLGETGTHCLASRRREFPFYGAAVGTR